LAVATLAGSIAIEELIFRWSWFSGGDLGARMPRPSLFGLDLGIGAVGSAYPRRAFVVTTLVVLALCLLMTLGISRGVVGRRWRAVRDNERAASAAGIDVAGVKLTAFAVSALLAGIGGVMLGYQRQIVTGSSFALFDSLMVVAVVYLAGIATPSGALLAGALASGGVLTVALARMGDSGAANQLAVSGLLLMVVVVWLPTGVFGSVAHVGRAVRGRSRWPSGPTRSGTFVG
jgi:ABC-type branched-subunit amino acid transport system permease subunit